MSKEDSKEKVQSEIKNLKVDLKSKPIGQDQTVGRTTLIIRDLPANCFENEIRFLFTDTSVPSKKDIVSLTNDFGNNWSLRFPTEELCVKAALYLRDKKLRGNPVHCRVAGVPAEKKRSPISDLSSPFPIDLSRYGDISPIFYGGFNSSYSPILSPVADESFLEKIQVPPGVFGEYSSPVAQSIPVSPMVPILGPSPVTQNQIIPPNYTYQTNNNQTEQIESQYKKILKMKQKSLEQQKTDFFPPNMVKSFSKRRVAKYLARLAQKEYEVPKNFLDSEGAPRYFKRDVVERVVRYGTPLPLNNPNRSKFVRIV